jgi:hypothetical protein
MMGREEFNPLFKFMQDESRNIYKVAMRIQCAETSVLIRMLFGSRCKTTVTYFGPDMPQIP